MDPTQLFEEVRELMATSIEWTDRTWNPIRGCSRVSEGCRNCYAEAIAARFSHPGNSFHGFAERTPDGPRWTGDVVLLKDRLLEPLSWKKPARVFVNSMSDLFHENLSDEAIDQVFAVMALSPQHTFQILTKRAERMRDYMLNEDTVTRIEEQLWEMHTDDTTNAMPIGPLRNVWLGVSVENQQFADERIKLLLDTPAAVRFISAEPLLGPINLAEWLFGDCRDCGTAKAACDGLRRAQRACCPDCRHRRIDWVIVGGESGPKARMFDVDWARAIVAQCKVAGVACFVKQLGADAYESKDELLGYLDLKDKKGGDPSEWPADLRVREYPEARA